MASRLFILNALANIAWLLVWHYEYLILSFLIMLVILITLVMIYNRLGIANHPASLKQHLFLYIPFSLYTGWIVVASLVNLSVVQNAMGWEDAFFSETNWTLLKLAITAIIAAAVVLRRGDVFFGLVIAWAAYGIMMKQGITPEVFGAAAMVSALGIILVAYEAIRQLLGNTSAPA